MPLVRRGERFSFYFSNLFINYRRLSSRHARTERTRFNYSPGELTHQFVVLFNFQESCCCFEFQPFDPCKHILIWKIIHFYDNRWCIIGKKYLYFQKISFRYHYLIWGKIGVFRYFSQFLVALKIRKNS